jgi:hypothetical protein
MHIHRALADQHWPEVRFHGWRFWDAFVAWPDLEPSKGKWNFETLDRYVDLAEKNKVDILFPLGLSPAWASARPSEESAYKKKGYASEPRNIEDWRNYVRTVATRYKGRIKYYEIWNEPNLPGFFSGSVETMIVLTKEARKIFKEVDPSIVVVSSAATAPGTGPVWIEKFLKQGGGEYVDIIGYHFYVSPQPPEDMVQLVRSIKGIMTKYAVKKPLWNTESGWFMSNQKTTVKADAAGFKSKVLSKDEGMAYIARAYILNWSMGVERLYWYAWDDSEMGLTEADGKTVKVQAAAYTEIQNWLVGARMVGGASDADGTWTCQLARDGGYSARIVWNPTKKVSLDLPTSWRVTKIRELTGNKRAAGKGVKTVEIGPIPLLLESNTH